MEIKWRWRSVHNPRIGTAQNRQVQIEALKAKISKLGSPNPGTIEEKLLEIARAQLKEHEEELINCLVMGRAGQPGGGARRSP